MENTPVETTRALSSDQLRSLKFAGAGYALALIISAAIMGGDLVEMWFYAVWAAGSLGVLNLMLATLVARFISKNRVRSMIGGTLYSWLIVGGSTISCGLLSLVLVSSEGGTLFDWIVKPLYWVLLVGGIPAAVLGAAFGEVTWRAHGQQRERLGLMVPATLGGLLVCVIGFQWALHREAPFEREMRWTEDASQLHAEVQVRLVATDGSGHYMDIKTERGLKMYENRQSDVATVAGQEIRSFWERTGWSGHVTIDGERTQEGPGFSYSSVYTEPSRL